MYLAWRRFTGLSFDQEGPHHSTLEEKLETNTRPASATWIAGIRSVCISILVM
jgi:hypothetical protein